MSYFPSDIPYMSEKELLENGIKIPKIEPYLKPCPFCEGKARLVKDGEAYKVYCISPACDAQYGWCATKEKAIQGWNRRAAYMVRGMTE